MNNMRSNNKRQLILDSALEVVEQLGASHLTIDAVALQSGMSKGGVLYHFASKKALLSGMLDAMIEQTSERMRPYRQSDKPLKALTAPTSQMTARERLASLALLAAAGESPELLNPARDYLAEMMKDVSASVNDQTGAQIVFLAQQGMQFLDVLAISPIAERDRDALLLRLDQLADEVSTR